MATTTAKLGLRKPDRADLVYVPTDIDANMDAIDLAAGDVICTSLTRPSTTWNGMTAYETDTGAAIVRSGAAWKYQNDPTALVTSGARPSVPVSGTTAFETDTGNEIVWDAFNWSHPSIPVVSALAQILRVRTGQVVMLTTDNNLYRYTGSAWEQLTGKGMYSRYNGTSTATTANGWTAIPFATRNDGAGTGLSVASNTTFTLVTPGKWTFEFFGVIDASGAHPGVTGGIIGLATSTAFTTFYSEDQSPAVASQVAGTAVATILTTGTATVVAGVFTAGAASAMATGGILPRLSCSWAPS